MLSYVHKFGSKLTFGGPRASLARATTVQWLVTWLIPKVMIEIATANRMTPTMTIKLSRSLG